MAFDDVVDVLDQTAVVAVVTTRQSGDSIATPIWSMVIDGVPYLRSAFGESSWWYRHILAERPVSVVMGDGSIAERDRDATLELPREPVKAVYIPADDPVQDRIDVEIQSKYGNPGHPSVDAMLSAQARACTLRIEPTQG